MPKAEAGQFAANKIEPGEGLWEFRLDQAEGEDLAPGSEIKVDLFKPGQHVNVAGISKGKGYAGTVKRHHFATQDATHGNSRSHRAPGSIGQRQTPGRVFPGKRMSGQLGNARRTAERLEVVRVDTERNLILVRGAVPGAASGRVILLPAVK
jgi:large subunit ribosomal protein L3